MTCCLSIDDLFIVSYQLLCEMVDSIVGQANMIRSILGLPERELVEDTSQEEGMSMVWL